MAATGQLDRIRERVLPMLEIAAENYRGRVPAGYPNVVDDPERGVVGLELDPNYALYLTAEGDQLFAELYRRLPRADARSSAQRQKYGGLPFQDRRPLPADVDDQGLRNLIAELQNAFNMQPGLLFITDD